MVKTRGLHIVISGETKKELDKLIENKGDTYDDIVKKLLETIKKWKKNKKNHK